MSVRPHGYRGTRHGILGALGIVAVFFGLLVLPHTQSGYLAPATSQLGYVIVGP